MKITISKNVGKIEELREGFYYADTPGNDGQRILLVIDCSDLVWVINTFTRLGLQAIAKKDAVSYYRNIKRIIEMEIKVKV